MAKDKPPHDPHSSSDSGDQDDRAPESDPRLEETTEFDETTSLSADGLDKLADDSLKTVGNQVDVTLPSIDSDLSQETNLSKETTETCSKTVANQSDVTAEIVDPNATQETLAIDSSIVGEETVGHGGDQTIDLDSALSDIDISQTINPRELSDDDAKAWETLVSEAVSESKDDSGFKTDRKPAVERSFTETKLFIRDRDVAATKDDPSTPSDYRLVRLLGKGGMGNVYVAKQGSLDRLIAVKVIKPLEGKRREKLEQTGKLEDVERDRRHQFLSEAVVTGDLDHPNIVPIHDIAVTSDNTLFYAMKRVVGTPWSKVIKEKSRDENVDILLKVCDAIGFAHTRGVVHRDIKPENIMLGDFGVVMVMDWGLALPQADFEKIDSIAHSAGLGGTPAFMAPEMATGPLQKIGPPADIYLLGATLFYIVTGKPPHHGDNVSLCLQAVTANQIRDVEPIFQGELLNIALKAMATNPADRYSDVREFQNAIREYRAHAESVSLASRADADLQLANQNQDYADFSRARFGFEQAIAMWSGNDQAKQGLADTLISHANAAHDKQDFDLGLSLLDSEVEAHQPLIEKLIAGRQLRQQRASRLRLFKMIAAAMLAFILVGGTVAGYVINVKRNEAVAAKKVAEDQTQIARAQKEEADRQRDNAEKQEKIALDAKDETQRTLDQLKEANAETEKALAEVTAAEAEAQRQKEFAQEQEAAAKLAARNEKEQRKLADLQKQRAEYETYLSQIGLAKARIESNEFDDARKTLQDVKSMRQAQAGGLAWEWRWLWRQANQSDASQKAPDTLIDLALFTAEGNLADSGIAVLADGSLQPFAIDHDGHVSNRPVIRLGNGAEATAVAIGGSEGEVAVGTMRGDILLYDRTCADLRQTLTGHDSRVTALQYVDGNHLVSGSMDKTARIWDIDQSSPLETCWHIASVRDLAATRLAGEIRLATAVADSSTGRAVVWSIDAETWSSVRRGDFLQHRLPLASIALSADGKNVATGDVAGNLFLWSPSDAAAVEYSEAIASAVDRLSGDRDANVNRVALEPKFKRMVDPAVETSSEAYVSTKESTRQIGQAHRGVIRSIRFSTDGKRLVSASDDYTLKVWDGENASLQESLRGHGGWVTNAVFVGDSHEVIVSVSSDMTVRRWDAKTYVGPSKTSGELVSKRTDLSSESAIDEDHARAHADEVLSARFGTSGQRIVTASRDHSARVLQVDPTTMAFSELATFQHNDEDRLKEGTAFMAMSFAIDRNHGRLFVGSADAKIRIWDLENGNELAQATGTGLNSSFALSRDGSLLLTGSSSEEFQAVLWRIGKTNSVEPQLLTRIRQRNHAVTAFAISDDNTMLFTGDRTGRAFLWDVATGKQLGERLDHLDGFRINAVSFSADSKQLFVAADDEQVTRIDIASRELLGRLPHDGLVTQLSISSDGTQAVTVSEMTTNKQVVTEARLWNLDSLESRQLHRIESKAGDSKEVSRITSARFGDQSRWVIVSVTDAEKPARVMRWDAKESARSASKPVSLQLPRQLGSLQGAMPIGNQRMVTLNGDAAFLWDLESKSHIKSYREHGAITHAAFSHDEKYLVTASRSVKIWDAQTGRSMGKLESPHEGLVRSVDFDPTKLELATGGDDGFARRWSWNPEDMQFRLIDEFKTVGLESSEPYMVQRVRYSPDASSLLVTGDSGMTRLWFLGEADSQSNWNLDIAGAPAITCGEFSSDGNWIVIGSDDKMARLIRIADRDSDKPRMITFSGHADRIEDVSIIQDASEQLRVLTASRDKSARVWDPRLESRENAGREVIALRRHTQGVTAVDVTSSGSIVMTAGRDGDVILWPAAKADAPHEEHAKADNLHQKH